MAKKEKTKREYEIIIEYADKENGKPLQELMQKLFNSYITKSTKSMKSTQNIKKGR